MKRGMKSLANITWERLETRGGHLPQPVGRTTPASRSCSATASRAPRGRAKFTPASVVPPDESPDDDFPMILITGRQLEHWHTGSMTRRATVLDALEPEASCSMHPRTLRALGVAGGDRVRIRTRRGDIEVMARSDRAVAEGQVFMPFAYVEAAANLLTNPALDPFGKIPEFKYSAARVEAIERRADAPAEATAG